MAFSTPSVHRVEEIKSDAVRCAGYATLRLTFAQQRVPGLPDSNCPAHLDIFGDSAMADKFERAAAAINAIFAETEQSVRQAAE